MPEIAFVLRAPAAAAGEEKVKKEKSKRKK